MLLWLPSLYRDRHFRGTIGKGRLRSFLLRLAFAFGWTPCAEPVLVAMLMLASTQARVTRGAALLSVYSAGLAVPFMLVAVGTRQFGVAVPTVAQPPGLGRTFRGRTFDQCGSAGFL
jgi:cytochrome c-type biogenesis protein